MGIKILTLIMMIVSFGGAPLQNHKIYTRCMEVTNLNYETDEVTCVDAVGFEWKFKGCEDYYEKDIVCAIMDNQATEETIEDDIILDVDYSGYWME